MPSARRKKKKSGKGAAGKKGKKKSGAIESELNVYGIEWGLGVAAGSALIEFLYFRYGLFGDLVSMLFGGSLTVFLFVFAKIILLSVGLYFAAWFIDEQRYPPGNIMIIMGLQAWAPKLGFMAFYALVSMTGLGLEIAILIWPAWIWMVAATFAIYKGLLETENEGFIMMLVLATMAMNWYLQEHAYEAATQLSELLQSIGKSLGIV